MMLRTNLPFDGHDPILANAIQLTVPVIYARRTLVAPPQDMAGRSNCPYSDRIPVNDVTMFRTAGRMFLASS
jgi:hypothetical protein